MFLNCHDQYIFYIHVSFETIFLSPNFPDPNICRINQVDSRPEIS